MDQYKLEGPRWSNNSLTWSFANATGADLAGNVFLTPIGSVYQDTVRQALQRWSSVSGLTFNQVADSSVYPRPADIRIGFSKLGTGSTGVIGQTYYGATNSVFNHDVGIQLEDPNDSPVASVSGSFTYTNYGVTLFQVALHELGHALGLDHNNNPTSIMYSSVNASNRDLNSGDTAGIQALYGPPTLATPIVLPVVLPPVVIPPVIVPPVATPPVAVPPIAVSGTNTLVLHLSEDAYQGNAQFTVSIDGQQVGGTQTATALRDAGQSQDFSIKGNFGSSAHTVGVTFLNDAWGGTAATDRNLFVDSMDFNGTRVANAKAALWSNGTTDLAVPGTTDTITFNLSEDAYQGDAQAIIRVDGRQLGGVQTITASHALGQSQAMTFLTPAGTGPHSATVQFLNDAWGGTAATDRNVYVGSIDFNGSHYADASTTLYSNGASSFSIPGTTAPSTAAFTIDHGLPHAFIIPV